MKIWETAMVNPASIREIQSTVNEYDDYAKLGKV